MKKTVVIGASPNPSRYSHRAVISLLEKDHKVVPIGIREGNIEDLTIRVDKPTIEEVDTISLYVGPRNQEHWSDYISNLNPKRVIFNPGTENEAYEKELESQGIQTERACTLVLLSIGAY